MPAGFVFAGRAVFCKTRMESGPRTIFHSQGRSAGAPSVYEMREIHRIFTKTQAAGHRSALKLWQGVVNGVQ
jgi:hypothetical protein